MSLESLIRMKMMTCPVWYAGTLELSDASKALFPYPNHWRGDYRSPYPMIESRRAGFKPRITTDFVTPIDSRYGFRKPCFETAPFTQIPCYARFDKDDALCVARYDMR